MKITNSKNEVYKFTDEEVIDILIWAFGYMDLEEKRLLPIDIENNVENATLKRKLRQCIEGDIEIIQRTKIIKGDDYY